MTILRFTARYDRLAKIVSALVAALLLFLPLLVHRAGALPQLVAWALWAVLGLAYAYSPRGYEISGGTFRIKRLIGDVLIPLGQLQFVRKATAADLWGCVRLWGSGGLFGYFGLHWSKALGRSWWYVTDRNNAVMVTHGDQVIFVSPDDRDGFIEAIRRPDSPPPPADPGSGERTGSPFAIGLAVGATALALVAAAMLYSPGPAPVDLTPDSLVIHSRFYGMTVPASSVDAAAIRVVDLQAEPGWNPVRRTGGFGNPFYRAGNFRTANGRSVKLFTAGARTLVLLPPSGPDGIPVLLDAAQPDQLVRRIREKWQAP